MNIIYSQTENLEDLQKRFRLKSTGNIPDFRRRLFIKKNSTAPLVMVGSDHKRHLHMGAWGLFSPGNTCVSTLSGKDIPKWHSMMEPPRRCLIPATSFAVGSDPTWFCFEDSLPFSLFAMAGLVFQKEDRLCFILMTVEANKAVRRYNRTMPMILKSDEYACWLHAPWDFASDLMAPYEGSDLHVVNANGMARTA